MYTSMYTKGYELNSIEKKLEKYLKDSSSKLHTKV